MYCIKCGVKLENTEIKCPLCGTVPFHPEIKREISPPIFPKNSYPSVQINTKISLYIISTLFLLAGLITFLCNMQIAGKVTWSGVVIGALFTGYICFILPCWFKKPNPIIFIPCSFVTIGGYLAFINYLYDANWFLTFAFPLVTATGIITSTVITLIKCLKKGYLYIFGGALLAYGAFMFPLEILINITFTVEKFVFWSIYPITALAVLGGLLIFLAIYKPARDSVQKRLFV